MLFVEIILGNNKILLGVGYRPPQGNLVEAINLLDRTLSSLIPLYDYVLVLGDFNVNFLVDNQISHCFSSYNLHRLLLEPTRIAEHSATLLDPIFLYCVDKCLKVGTVSAETFSGHLVVYCHISMKTIKPQPKTITYRDFKNFDDNSFTEELFSIDWLIIVYIRDIELRNLTKTATIAEKRNYLSYLSKQTNSAKFYQALKSFRIQETKTSDVPECLSEPNRINNFFASVFQNSDNACEESTKFYSQKSSNTKFYLRLIDMSTLIKIINNIKSNACGTDGITVEMLKLCLPAIAPYLLHIVNSCLEIGFFPNCWKTAIVVPLPKVPNPTSLNDLRPISLLPVLSKVLEKAVRIQLHEFLSDACILPVYQAGFRKGQSTTSALARITDDVISAADNSKATALVLLDFSKAFDTINHNLLVSKCRYLGFDILSTKWLRCYLNERHQYVVVKNKISMSKPICSGVPQGSVLGPLLFLMYIFNLPNVIKHCSVQLYADDTQIYFSFQPENYESATSTINTDLQHITTYAQSHSLRFNAAKSSSVLFCSRKNREFLKSVMKIKVNDQDIPFSQCAKDIGLYIDENLRFQQHVENISKVCYLRLRLLYASRLLLNKSIRKALCESLILPKISYCNIIYFPCLDAVTKYRLQKIQNSCCRYINNLRKYDHVTAAIKSMKWSKIQQPYEYSLIAFMMNVLKSFTPAYLKEKLVTRRVIHDLNTRYNCHLFMPQHRTAMFQRFFTYNAVKSFNMLSPIIRNNFTKKSLKKLYDA
nr:unnamed protein product [Callosobruchus analis]